MTSGPESLVEKNMNAVAIAELLAWKNGGYEAWVAEQAARVAQAGAPAVKAGARLNSQIPKQRTPELV